MGTNLYISEIFTASNNDTNDHQPYGRLVIAGLISASALSLVQPAQAADIGSLSADTIRLNDGDRLTADQRNNGVLYGILNSNGRTANIDLANDVSITATDITYTEGIIIAGRNTELKANRLALEVKGSGRAMNVSGTNNTIDLGTDSKVSLLSSSNNVMNCGICLTGAASLQATGLSIQVTGDNAKGLGVEERGTNANLGEGSAISTKGKNSYGLFVFGGNGALSTEPTRFDATSLEINTEGTDAYGINNQQNTDTDLGSQSKITTSGERASGLWNEGQFTADALTIAVTGMNANGVESFDGEIDVGADSHVSAQQGGALVTNNASSSAIINYLGTAQQRNTLFSGGSYAASAQFAGAAVNLSYTDIRVDRNGATGMGLWALGGGRINGDNLSISGASGIRGVYAMTGSQIDLTGNTVIHMDNPADMAIATQYNEGYAASRINASGKMDINGAVAARGGVINLDMVPGSRWTGQADSDGVNNGALTITMTDSRWEMIADSSLDNLVLHNSTVDLAEHNTSAQLTVGNLSGNGNFILHTDIVGQGKGVNNSGDKLVVTGSSAGAHKLTIANQGSLSTTGQEVLSVVETPDGQATFSSASMTELGGYLYDIRQKGNDWELYSSGSKQPDPAITTSGDAGANFLNIGYLINRAENQTLLQRMGYMRQTQEHGDMWIKGFAGKYDAFSSGKLSGFDMNYNGIQIGADKRVSDTLPLYIGPFMGLTSGDPDYGSGDGLVKSSYLGVYGTYVTPDGFYIDTFAKYSSLRNQFTVQDSQNSQVAGTGRSGGFSLSLETGKRFNITRPLNGLYIKGLYIEPQAEIAYTHQNASTIKATNGLKVNLGSYESVIARASAILGYELLQGDNSVNAYLKTGVLREFAGDAAYSLNGSLEDHTFKGSWWNNGVGVSAQLNNAHTLYMDVDYSTGSKFDRRQINGGYRFSF